MTRRTFVLLVCRFVGLLSAMEFIQGKFGVPGFNLVYNPVFSNGDAAPLWVLASVTFPIIACSLGIGIGIFSRHIASRVAPGGDVASVRFGYAISTVLVSWAALQGAFAVANYGAKRVDATDPTMRLLLLPRFTDWPVVAILLYAIALAWLVKRGLTPVMEVI